MAKHVARVASRGPGRPTPEETARLDDEVRRTALELFLERGFEHTSVDAVADAAGTTKASIYKRYANKRDLFRDAVLWAMHEPDWPYPEPPLPDFGDLDRSLRAIADAAMRRATDPKMVSLSRLAICQIARFPDIASRSEAASTWWRARYVVELLEFHAATGEVIAPDPEMLAEHFLAMVSGMPARLASMGRIRDPETQEKLTQAAVDLFLRAIRA